MQRCRTFHLGRVAGARRALTVGEGDGRFLMALLAAAPEAHVTVVDASARMLQLARGRLDRLAPESAARVEFVHAELGDVELSAGDFDLIATCFFLDCFEGPDLARVVERLARAARPDALWLVSDFHQPAGGWRALRARAWLALLYGFFGATTGLATGRLEVPAPAIGVQGFALESAHEFRGGLLRTELWRRPESASS